MSYAKLEAKIRTEALQDVARRAEQLGRTLGEAKAAGTAAGEESERELRYLERMTAAAPQGDRRSDLATRIAGLRRCFDELVRLEAAQAAHAVVPVTSWGAPSSPPAARPSQPPAQPSRPSRPPAQPSRPSQPPAQPSRPSQHSQPAQSLQPREAGGGEGSFVAPVASFLRPRQSPDESEDEVRLLSAEGMLAQELQRFPMLSVPGTESTLIFRRLKSWSDEDDADERRRERLAVLELSQAAINLREMQELVEQHVAQDQEPLDEIEQRVAESRERVSEAVITLASARNDSERVLAWLAPSVGLVILGGGLASIAPAAAAGCVACVLVRGGITMGALGFHIIGSKRLKTWQQHALESMTEHLPRAFDSLPEQEVKLLSSAGDEAQRRLLAKLGDRGSWSSFYTSAMAMVKGLPVLRRESDVRVGGYAFSTSFTAKRIRAREAFKIVRQLSLTGSLDPGCEVAWSRPVDEKEEGTSLRYLIFSNLLGSRDFYCVCRCLQAEPPPEVPSPTDAPAERFAFAVVTLAPELLASAGLPQSNKGMEHGSIHVSGISVSDDGEGGSLVEVMADVDSVQSWLVPTWVADSEVRIHVLRTAEHLAQELKCAAKEAAYGLAAG